MSGLTGLFCTIDGRRHCQGKRSPENCAGQPARAEGLETGSPGESGYYEGLNGRLREECRNGEIFYSLQEGQIVMEQWREEYITRRPHSALDYRPRRAGGLYACSKPRFTTPSGDVIYLTSTGTKTRSDQPRP